jgi:carboxymethylenebutenolidase
VGRRGISTAVVERRKGGEQMQEFEVSGTPVTAYLAVPASGSGPGVVVLHAWWGLTDFFREVCERLASEGFVALAPDLYHGATAATVEKAHRLRSAVDRRTANKELKAAVGHLCAHQAVSSSQIGVIGFSLGGNYALWLARNSPKAIKAVVLFYGTGGGKFDNTQARFLGHFAESDEWGAGPDKARSLEDRLRAAGRDVTFHTYAGTEHWFFEADRPAAYSADAARLAWERTVDFMRNQLA